MQDNSQKTIVVKPKPNKNKWSWYIAAAVLVCGILICLAYFGGTNSNAGKSPGGPASQTPAASTPQNTPAQNTTPAVVTPPKTPVNQTPAPASTPSPALPTPPPKPTPTVTIPVSSALITKQAYQMVLTLDDMGQGWMAGSAASPGRPQVYSSSHMTFTKGSAFSPVVQNTVDVYRTVDAAMNAFTVAKPANLASITLSYPNIGDECFLNDSVPTNKLLVFRKNNVVASIIVQQDKTSDLVSYAQIVERKITP